MSGGFQRRRRRGGVKVTFEPLEVALLQQFLAEVIGLLESQADASLSPLGDDLADLDAVETIADFERLTAEVTAPDDPVLRRLLPDAYSDDPEASSDFRRFTQDSLIAQKRAAARTALMTLAIAHAASGSAPDRSADVEVPIDPNQSDAASGSADDETDGPVEVVLTADDAQAWLAALNDVRLALGVRLGVEQDDDERWANLPEHDPRAAVHEVYSWLGWLQETLVHALS